MFLRQRIPIDGTSDLQLDTSDPWFGVIVVYYGYSSALNYCITSGDGTKWEYGTTAITEGGRCVRTVTTSSAGAATLETFGAGTHSVFLEK